MEDIDFETGLTELTQKPNENNWLLIVNPSTLVGYKIQLGILLQAQGYSGPLLDVDGNQIATVATGLITDVALALEPLETPDGHDLETPDEQPLETFVRNY